MFSKSLETSLQSAYTQAVAKKHEFITVEHLLLALLDNPETSKILIHCGANLERLRANLSLFIDETTPHIPINIEKEIMPSLSFQQVLQQSIYQVQLSNGPEVTGVNVLIALFEEKESQAIYLLWQEKISQHDVINCSIQENTKYQKEINENKHFDQIIDPNFIREISTDETIIENYAINLNEKAKKGLLDPLIGRELELKRTMQILSRRRKNNPLFVGESGVGKTAIVEGLANLIVEGKVPESIEKSIIYSLDLGLLLAGTKYRGDFEKRLKSILKAINKVKGSIVFIDEIHNLIGAGAAAGGSMDASNLIKPLLSTDELCCIGATTYDEYRKYFSKDRALLRRFQKIDVVEPSPETTFKILQKLKPKFESFHKVEFTDEALFRAIELSTKYMLELHLPDKAIDVIDEAGANNRIKQGKHSKVKIEVSDIEEVVANMTQIPLKQLSRSDKNYLKILPNKLKKIVYDQDEAIDVLSNAIKLTFSGLREANKPIGSFLMAGPTGVGKTEVTRQLALALNLNLIRLDMSEYMEKHAVARLIGAPPGYVGYEQGGLLTEEITKNPHSVLLLDEIEKAHSEIYNILLQVMDYGTLTDSNGRKVDFRHVIVVMTTNAGAELLEKTSIGFANSNVKEDSQYAIQQCFSPEFRNRLDAVVHFGPLQRNTILKIVNKNLQELHRQLVTKGVRLEVTQSAKRWLAKKGYDRKMGARPMIRLIQEQLKKPLAEELLYGKLATGKGFVKINTKNDRLLINITH